MERIGALGVLFNRIGECSSPQILQLIAPLLAIPCLKASNFLFKLAYVACSACASAKAVCREDLLIKLDGLFEDLRSIPQTSHSLYDISRRLDRIEALGDGEHIWHKVRS
jgi:hypothetical protein